MAKLQAAMRNKSSDANNEKVFDFFGLPPELRNTIYDMLTRNAAVPIKDSGNCTAIDDICFIKTHMLDKCLLLNHRFKDEYESRVGDNQQLIFEDFNYDVDRVELHGTAKKTTSFAFKVILTCSHPDKLYDQCDCSNDVAYHCHWMGKMFEKLEGVRFANFEIYPCWEQRNEVSWDAHASGAAAEFKALVAPSVHVEMSIYPTFFYRERRTVHIYEDKAAALGKWTREEGWRAI